MRYGRFDKEMREYVIERPDTPLPWINYLGESKYCALISNTAGGYSFHVDPRDRRILRYRYDNIPFDQGGRYLYIKDNKSGEFFSPTWQPVRKKLDKYECRHGMGYTKIASKSLGIETEITYFVPLGEDLEVWSVEIRNTKSEIRDLSLFSFIEFCLWDAVGDSTNFQRTWNIGKAHCEGSTIIHDTLYGSWSDIFAYFSVNEKIDSYDCQRKSFLGDQGYNNLDNPEAVIKGKGSNSEAIGWAPIGSHCLKIKLKPKQKKTLIFVLGVASSKEPATKRRGSFMKLKRVNKELQKLKEYWDENLSKFQVKTPDPDLDLSLNTWNQYQCRQTFNWSRYASYYEAGIGRGMGFRDSNQDTLGFAHMLPKEVKTRILDLAAIQFEEGDTYHQYSPITKKGALYGYSDDPLWLIFSTANYIKETGDKAILNTLVPFAKRETMVPAPVGHYQKAENTKQKTELRKKAALYEHLKRAILFVSKKLGKHKLPLSGFADWNDCINLDKGGESVLVGMMLVAACEEMGKIAELPSTGLGASRKQKADLRIFKRISEKMKGTLNKTAWDGSWYKRAFDHKGKPLGSKACKDGSIYLEPQPWAVISGVADKGRALACMDSVYSRLFSKYGITLQQPPLRKYYPEYGEISTYPPGLKENASIFCHPNPWAMVAECMLGRGNLAYKYYKAILPISQNKSADIRKTEPYVYCQMIAGEDHPDFGEGKNSWLTGSAAWNFVAASQYILGIRPEYKGLRIDPCIPKAWKSFSVRRVFRGAAYNVKIKNPYGRSKGVKSLQVDGRYIEGNLVPVFKDRKEHSVEAILE